MGRIGVAVGVLLFVALMVGGGIYRSECEYEGRQVVTWSLEGFPEGIPFVGEFLIDPPDECSERITLISYLVSGD